MKHPLSIARIKAEKGQGMVEYIIIVALIAIAAIGVYSQFGKSIRGQVGMITQELSGESATTDNVDNARDAAGDLAAKEVTLGTYKETATTGAKKKK